MKAHAENESQIEYFDLKSARGNFSKECADLISKISKIEKRHGVSSMWRAPIARPDKRMEQLMHRPEQVSPRDVILFSREFSKTLHSIKSTLIPKLACVRVSLEALQRDDTSVLEDCNQFRFVCERLAVLTIALEAIEKEIPDLNIVDYNQIISASESCLNLAFGTRFDIQNLYNLEFEDMPKTEYKYDESIGPRSFATSSVLSSIDKVHKRYLPGFRPFYDYVCEYVHPNVGDMNACWEIKSMRPTSDNYMLITRQISHKPQRIVKKFHGIEMHDVALIERSYKFFKKILNLLSDSSEKAEKILHSGNRTYVKYQHKVAKRNRDVFEKNAPCPCGSGLTISACRRR